MKDLETCKIRCIFLKKWIQCFISTQLFSLLYNFNKNYVPIYLRCLALIQSCVSGNILSFEFDIAFSVLMFQILTNISRLTGKKIKTLHLHISTEN